jgi:hypothetical protein
MWWPIPADSEDGKIIFFNNMLEKHKWPSALTFRDFIQAPIAKSPEFSYLIKEMPDPFGGSQSLAELNSWETLIYAGGRSVHNNLPCRYVDGCDFVVDDVTADIVGLIYYAACDAENELKVYVAAMFKPVSKENLKMLARAFNVFLYRKRCRYSRIEIRAYKGNPFKKIYKSIESKYFRISNTAVKDCTDIHLTAVETT